MPTPVSLMQLLGKMHMQAAPICDKADEYVVQLNHHSVKGIHLLLGMLALGNKYPSFPKQRLLRDAGADFDTLYVFLFRRAELRTGSGGGESAERTLQRAYRIAQRRYNEQEEVFILTTDVLQSLLRSKDPLLVKAFKEMGVDTRKLRRELTVGLPKSPRPQHLQRVS